MMSSSKAAQSLFDNEENLIMTENGAIVSTKALTSAQGNMSLSAKAAAVGMKALAIAGNMIAMWAISKGIELAVKGIDNLVNASKHAAKNAQSLSSIMKASINSMSDNVSTLSDLNDEYKELSKGVNQLGENISLSTDDYSTYKDIISQVSAIMPNLTTYFDSQGKKIAFAKGKLEDLNKEYEKYVQNEAIKFVTNGDNNGNKIQDILDNYNYNKYESLSGFQKFLNGLSISLGGVRADNFTSKEIIAELEKLQAQKSIQEIDEYLTSYQKDFKGAPDLYDRETAIKLMLLGELGLSGKNQDEILSMTESDYNALMQKITAYIQQYNAKILSDMEQTRTALLQMAYSKDSFWALEKDSKNDVTTFLSSINSDVWDALNIQTDHELSIFVNKIIDSIANNTDGFADAWNNLFSLESEDLSPEEYTQQINNLLKTICDTLGLDEVNGVCILKIGLGFENVDVAARQYTNTIKNGAEKFSGVSSSTYGNNADADLYYEEVLNDLDAFAKENSINTSDEIAFWNKCIEESDTRQKAMDMYLNHSSADKDTVTFSDIFSLKNADGTLTTLGRISESIDTVQNAYNTLSSAIDEYNNNGVISIDTLQSVMELGDDWLDYLVAEDGALKLDKESLDELAQSRLDEMRIREINNLIDSVKQIKDNGDAYHYLASTNYEAAESFEEVARESALATAELLKAKVASGDLSPEFYDAVIEKMYNDIDKLNAFFDSTATNLSYKASSTAKSFTDLLDKELAVLDKKMEAGYIDFNDYIQARLEIIEDYYHQGKISADEYYSYLEKHYDTQLSYMDKVVNAVTRRIDKEIDALEKQKSEIEDGYQVQIDSLEKQKTLLQEANQERQRQINLQKALYELERAKNQRTKLVYSEDKGMHYVSDDSAIRDAQQEADDAEFDIQIADIDNSISKLEAARDAETEAIDAMIDKLEEYKDQWNDITSAYEEEQENLLAAQILGQDWENDILNTRLDTLTKFKDDYITLQQAMVDAAYQAAQAMANAEKANITDTSKGKLSGDKGKDHESRYEVVDESTATSVGGKKFDNYEAAEDYADKLNMQKAASYNMTIDEFVNSDIPGYYVRKYHTGLQQGLVDKNSFNKDFQLVQKVGLGQNEVPAILKEGEAVATRKQISNLADGIRSASLPDYLTPLPGNHPVMQMRKKFEALLNANELYPAGNPALNTLNDSFAGTISSISNSNHMAQQVTIGDINITCPGVTSQEVMKQVGMALNREFSGMALAALQESKKR